MADTRGRSTRRFKRMAAELRARREPCCLCGQPIDYELQHNHAGAFTVAHWKSVRDHPQLAEDPDNIRGAAHRGCNSSAGTDSEPLGLGVTSGAEW